MVKKPKLSVVMPLWNEEGRVGAVLENLKKARFIDEIVVVDDGSTDKSFREAKAQVKTTYSYKKNRGKGYAEMYGAEKATGDVIIIYESDGQQEIADIKRIYDRLKTNDIVFTCRDFSNVPWPRRVNNVLTSFAIFLATGRAVRDPLSGMFGARREKLLALGLKQDRFQFESELNIKALRQGLKSERIPIKVKYHSQKPFEFNKLNWKQSFLLFIFLLKSVLRFE
ncbi:MAG: glycosyltransferase family 2 protein [Candidatus Micrarchaeota archaeon]